MTLRPQYPSNYRVTKTILVTLLQLPGKTDKSLFISEYFTILLRRIQGYRAANFEPGLPYFMSVGLSPKKRRDVQQIFVRLQWHEPVTRLDVRKIMSLIHLTRTGRWHRRCRIRPR